MANDFGQTLQTAYTSFHQTVADYMAPMLMMTAPIVVPSDKYSITEQRTYGQTLWEAHSASPTAQDIKSEEHSTNVLDKDSLVKLSMVDVERNPGLVVNEATKMGRLYGLTVVQSFFGTVFALPETAHPYTGRPVVNSAAVKCVDSITFVPPGGARAPSGTPFVQSNQFGLGFGDQSVAALIAARKEFFSIEGNPVVGDPGPDAQRPLMVGPAAYEQEARGIGSQMSPLYDGAGIKWGVANMVESGYVIPPGGGTQNRWLLWWRSLVEGTRPGERALRGPVAPVFFHGPGIRITESPDSNYIHIIGLGGYTIRISGDVHQDVLMDVP
jgi:hypothetical protein